MKRIILFILLISLGKLYANPVVPSVNIYEIYFSESGDWLMEIIEPYGIGDVYYYLDSIKIESNAGIAMLQYVDSLGAFVISNSDLSQSIEININDDCIKLHSYSSGYHITDSIAIGEHPDSYLKNILPGQSIARYDFLGPFYKTNNPTIGAQNNLSGAIGIIYGIFYDENNNPVSGKLFYINEGYSGQIEMDADGHFCANLTSRSYDISCRLLYDSEKNASDTVNVNPVSFEINEHDSLNIDFRITATSIENNVVPDILLSNYPNPANDFTYFFVDYQGRNLSNLKISLFDLSGRIVDTFPVDSPKVRYDCSNLPPGIFISRLISDETTIATKKIIVVK
ncbi:MAG: T9SS type A sorting domain-containing protein [bacterium]